MPIEYELQNLLSLNAGRNEDQFRQVKKVCKELTNQQYCKPHVLLNAVMHLEAVKYYNVHTTPSYSSTFSKKITEFESKSPPPPISYTAEFLEKDKSVPQLIQRLSTYLVRNEGCKYARVENDCLTFSYKKCSDCKDGSCGVCVFPSFGINNIYSSSIKHIIDTKKSVYLTQIKPKIYSNSSLKACNLFNLVLGEDQYVVVENSAVEQTAVEKSAVEQSNPVISIVNTNIQSSGTQSSGAKPSGADDSLVCYTIKTRLPTCFKRLEKQIDVKVDNIKDIKTLTVKTLCKIYGKVDDDLLHFDRVVKDLERCQKKGGSYLESEQYFSHVRNYIEHAREHIHILEKNKVCLKQKSAAASLEVDIVQASKNFKNYLNIPCVKNLELYQKQILATDYILHNFRTESSVHGNITTEFDEGLTFVSNC